MAVSSQPRRARKSYYICVLPLPSVLFNIQLSTVDLQIFLSPTPYPLSPFLSTASELFSRLLYTTAPASLFFSSIYKLFAVTTGVPCNGTPSKGTI